MLLIRGEVAHASIEYLVYSSQTGLLGELAVYLDIAIFVFKKTSSVALWKRGEQAENRGGLSGADEASEYGDRNGHDR